MKKILALLLLATLAFSFTSCKEPAPEYRNDISCEALYKNAEKKVTLEGKDLEFVEKGSLALQSEPSIPDAITKSDDYYFGFTGGNSFDEYGILHIKDANNGTNVEDTKTLIKEYLDKKKSDELYRSYFPEEDYKLDEAEVRVYGSYVVYATLSKENRTAFFTAIEGLLKTV